jgi:anaerobic ribonucleoside-triphosphate reductase activating protein
MLVRKIFYPLKTLGPGIRLGLWTQGCPHACMKCMSKHTWAFDQQYETSLEDIKITIKKYLQLNPSLGLTISGGEPLLQEEMHLLLQYCKEELGIQDILLYTGFRLEEIQKINEFYMTNALSYIDVLVDGRYIDALNDNKPLRGSSNQQIHFLNPDIYPKYKPIIEGPRQFNIQVSDDDYEIIGVIPKDFETTLKAFLKEKGIIIHDDVS